MLPVLLKNMSAKFHVNIVDKKFQHVNDMYFRIMCINIRVVIKEICIQIPKNNTFIPTISVFMKKAIVYDFF